MLTVLPALPDVRHEGVVYAVVRFDGGRPSLATGVIVAFENAAVADRFARDAGLVDYQVVPIGFHIAAGGVS